MYKVNKNNFSILLNDFLMNVKDNMDNIIFNEYGIDCEGIQVDKSWNDPSLIKFTVFYRDNGKEKSVSTDFIKFVKDYKYTVDNTIYDNVICIFDSPEDVAYDLSESLFM